MKGRSLLDDVEFTTSRGFTLKKPVPDEVLPDCESCPKPELEPDNEDAVTVYRFVRDQQQRSSYSGHNYGLRFEALTAAIQWFWEAGWIRDPDEVMLRIWTIDEVANRIYNAKLDAAAESRRMESQRAAGRR